MRIATGGICHETSSFAAQPTTLREFEANLCLFRGQDILKRFRGTNNCTGGFIDGADKQGFQLVPLLWTFPRPLGVIEHRGYDQVKKEFLDRLAKEMPVDGLLLDLHGAMVIEGIDDGDGDVIEAVRKVVGPACPIVATFDLHGNHTQKRVNAATAIIGFDTYPHVDMAERGREAADLIVRVIRGEVKPVSAFRALPLFWSALCQATEHPPIDEAFRLVHDMERRPGILTVTLATGYQWADIPNMGPSVTVVADGDKQLARATADELGDWIWARRERWFRSPMTVKEGLARGEKEGKYPIILADQADNTGGGASGDSTEVLRTFLDLELDKALVLYMVDPEVAQQAHAAGVGAKISVSLGGKSHPVQGPPVPLEMEVIALSDGRFVYDGPMFAGLSEDLSTSAWLRHQGLNVVVVCGRGQPMDLAFARSLGIDCASMKYISVKSAVHFRSGFERIAGSIHNVNARGIHTHDFSQLPYKRRRKPMYPLETM